MSLLPNNNQHPLAPTPTDSEPPHDMDPLDTSPEQVFVDLVYNVVPVPQAEIFVADYRDQFAQNFPYVILPEEASISSLERTDPMLLLAILVTTSWKYRPLQHALNQLFLKSLSAKVFLEADRDLDLLCGLMVYLNWSAWVLLKLISILRLIEFRIHLHVAPKTQQVYRLMCIATSMAVDYGITRRPGTGRHRQLKFESVSRVPTGLEAADSEFWSPTARRAFLGCYHIATWSVVSSPYAWITR